MQKNVKLKILLDLANASPGLNQFNAQLDRAVNSSKLIGSVNVPPIGGLFTATGEFKAFETEAKKAGDAVDTFGKKAGTAGDAVPRGAFAKMFDGFDGGMSNAVTGLAGAAAATLTIQKAFQFLGETVEKFEKRETALMGVTATLHSMGLEGEYSADSLLKMAQGINEFNKHSVKTNDILDLSTYLLTFDKIGKDSLPRAVQIVVDLSRKMDTDLKGAALSVGIALDNPAEGLTRLGRSGVKFSKDEKDVIQSLVDTGKAAEAQEMIFDKLEKKVGGFARNTTHELDDYLGKIDVVFSAVERKIGGAIINVIEPLALAATELIPKNTTENLDQAAKSAAELGTRFETLAGRVTELGDTWNKTDEEDKLYKESLDALMTEYPNYFKNFDLNSAKFDDIKIAIASARGELDKYTEGMIRNALIQDRMNEIVEIGKKRVEATIARTDLQAQFEAAKRNGTADKLDESNRVPGHQTINTETVGQALARNIANAQKIIDDAAAAEKKLREDIGKIQILPDSTAPKDPAGRGGTGVVPKSQSDLDKEDAAAKKRVETAILAFDLGKKDFQSTVEALQKEAEKTNELQAQYEILKKIQDLTDKQLEKTGFNPESVPKLGKGQQWLGDQTNGGVAFVGNYIQDQPAVKSRFNFKQENAASALSDANARKAELEFAKSQYESDPKEYTAAYLATLQAQLKLHKSVKDDLDLQKEINNVLKQQKGNYDIFETGMLAGIYALTNALDTGFKQAWVSLFGEAHSVFQQFAQAFFVTIEQMIVKMGIFQMLKVAGPLGGITAMVGKAFGFLADGGIINEPVTMQTASGKNYIAGEAGAEAIIPLSRLKNYIGNVPASSGMNTRLDRIERRMANQKTPQVFIQSAIDMNKYRVANSDLSRLESTRKL